MLFGELDLGECVGMVEMLQLLKYEGMNAPSDLLRASAAAHGARRNFRMHCFASSSGSLAEHVARTANEIADALVQWPRLAKGLSAVARGGGESCGFTCTATRVWVRFPPPPKLRSDDGKSDVLFQYCAERPRPPQWLLKTLRMLGQLHLTLPTPAHTISCFRELDALVRRKMKTWFVEEYGRMLQCDEDERSAVRKFASQCIASTYNAGPRVGTRSVVSNTATATATATPAPGVAIGNIGNVGNVGNVAWAPPSGGPTAQAVPAVDEAVVFARSCVSLAEWLVDHQMALNLFFSGACGDERGDTVERSALAKALKARRVRVVQWREILYEAEGALPSFRAIEPLAFPPNLTDGSLGEACAGPCVLLSFEKYV
jgi:hypothetical protein